MDLVFKILLFVLGFLAVYHQLTKKYLNPYKLTMCFGKKGCGKSTLLTKLALQYQKKHIPVYSTEPIPGCYLIDYHDIGYIELLPGSVLLVDEVGMIWDNRKFKNFSDEVRDWFKLQRHRCIRVFLFSQTFDVDKKIRDLTDEMFLIEKKFRVFSYAKRISKKTVLNQSTAEAPSKLDENLEFDSLLFFWCGSRKFTFIPKYSKYFDSFVCPPLAEKELELVPGGWGRSPRSSNSKPRWSLRLPRISDLKKRIRLLPLSSRKGSKKPDPPPGEDL